VPALELEFPDWEATGPTGDCANRGFLAAGEKTVSIRAMAANRCFTESPPVLCYV
jgi:hypothetical protein